MGPLKYNNSGFVCWFSCYLYLSLRNVQQVLRNNQDLPKHCTPLSALLDSCFLSSSLTQRDAWSSTRAVQPGREKNKYLRSRLVHWTSAWSSEGPFVYFLSGCWRFLCDNDESQPTPPPPNQPPGSPILIDASHPDKSNCLVFCICGLIHLNDTPQGLTKPLKQLLLSVLRSFLFFFFVCSPPLCISGAGNTPGLVSSHFPPMFWSMD